MDQRISDWLRSGEDLLESSIRECSAMEAQLAQLMAQRDSRRPELECIAGMLGHVDKPARESAHARAVTLRGDLL